MPSARKTQRPRPLDSPILLETACHKANADQKTLAAAIRAGYAYEQAGGDWATPPQGVCRSKEIRPGVRATTPRWAREYASRQAATKLHTAPDYGLLLNAQRKLDPADTMNTVAAAKALGVGIKRVRQLCAHARWYAQIYGVEAPGDQGLLSTFNSEGLVITRQAIIDRLTFLYQRQGGTALEERDDDGEGQHGDPGGGESAVPEPDRGLRGGSSREPVGQPV